jgi:hypothetical protein
MRCEDGADHTQCDYFARSPLYKEMTMQSEDLGRCDGCDMPFTEYDRPQYEVTHKWGSGFVHDDCLDDTMTVVERVEYNDS